MNTPTWSVTYKYDGGACTEFVQADDAETAGAELMSRATPTYNPGAECKLAAVHRVLFYEELAALPHRGLVTAFDLTWDRRDDGAPFLIVERGSRLHSKTQRDYWMTAGRIVRTAVSAAAGEKMVAALVREMRDHGLSGIFDVVPREAVTLAESGEPYGCYTR
jgi:hypothetical protein